MIIYLKCGVVCQTLFIYGLKVLNILSSYTAIYLILITS